MENHFTAGNDGLPAWPVFWKLVGGQINLSLLLFPNTPDPTFCDFVLSIKMDEPTLHS